MSIPVKATLKKALKAIAAADTDLVSAIEQRFYSIRAAQDDRAPRDESGNLLSDKPYVTFFKMGVERVPTSGRVAKAIANYQFRCWSRVPLDAEVLSLLVRAAFVNFVKGTVEGVEIDSILPVNEFDNTAMDTDTSRMVCVSLDLQIKYTDPT